MALSKASSPIKVHKFSPTTKTHKRIHIMMAVYGGNDSTDSSYAVLTLTADTIERLLKRCAAASALKRFDESLAHLSFHGDYCEWLAWDERLDEVLDKKELVLLARRPRGKSVEVNACYVEFWEGEIYFNASEKNCDAPALQAGPLSREELEKIRARLAAPQRRANLNN